MRKAILQLDTFLRVLYQDVFFADVGSFDWRRLVSTSSVSAFLIFQL